MDSWIQDLRYAFRQLVHRPTFALTAVVTIAIGIGAATTIFSAADHVLLRPLPYRDAERVVSLWEINRAEGGSRREVSPGNYLEWEGQSRSFEVMGLAEPSGFDLTGDGPPQPVSALRVTPGFLSALGVIPALGRAFAPEDYVTGERVTSVLMAHGLWVRRFGADSSIVGRTIRLDDSPVTVRGILPPALSYPEPTDFWVPKVFRDDERADRRSSYMHAVGRLAAGSTLAQARSELATIAAQLGDQYPQTNRSVGAALVPLSDEVRGPVRRALLVLLGAVGLLLLIACVNVATLMVARAAERQRELAVRAALGAGSANLIRQPLLEALLIAVAGGTLGIALAWFGVDATATLLPAELARFGAISLDGRVLGFATILTIVSAVFFGLAPVRAHRRPDPGAVLKEGARATGDRGAARMRQVLVVGEIALALTLLVGAGLLGRSFIKLLENDLGFVPERRVELQVFLWDRNPTAEQRLQRAGEIAERLRAVPGVDAVGVVSALPFHPHRITASSGLVIEGRPAAPDEQRPRVFTTVASPDYFAVMGIPVRAGRSFGPDDRLTAPMVAVVNQVFVRRHFPGENPIGKRITIGVMDRPVSREIVGVVGDVRPASMDADPQPEVYAPLAQSGIGSLTFVVRTQSDPRDLMLALQATIWQVDPGQSIYHAATLPSLISETLSLRRFYLGLLAAFGLVALLLAGVGIHGLISYTTTRRSREIGIRMALGADRDGVLGLILRQGLSLALPGVALGLVGSSLVAQLMRQMLYEVQPVDPVTYGLIALLMLVVAVVATLLPARRATGVDPIVALRAE